MSALLQPSAAVCQKPGSLAYFMDTLARLQALLPPSEKTDLNQRTLDVWVRFWINRQSVEGIARDRGWSIPAVSWHLRRAQRLLEQS